MVTKSTTTVETMQNGEKNGPQMKKRCIMATKWTTTVETL